jgi:hypothetical protein
VTRLRAAVFAILAAACSAPTQSDAPRPALAAVSPKPPAKPAKPPAKKVKQVPLTGLRLLERGEITQLTSDKGHFDIELAGDTPAVLVIATNEQPLVPRSRAAHFRIAEQLAKGVVAPTAFRSLKIAELSKVADKASLGELQKRARVLATGRIEAVVTLAPSPTLKRVNIANLVDDQPVWGWEGKLVTRAPIADSYRTLLSEYQSLLAADWVVGNLRRKNVQLHEASGRITVADGNEVFSQTPEDLAVHDGLARLARHMTYSKSLSQRLGKLTKEKAARLLGDWVTPKQAEEVADNARALERVIETRVKQRGDDALSLP